VSLSWHDPDKETIEQALRRFPAESGMCAPLARVVLSVARPIDAAATGLQVKPKTPARYILPKHPRVSVWYSHTLVRTREHHVDALTGAGGCEHDIYLQTHWNYPEALRLNSVDVNTVDAGVQHAEK